MAIAEAANFEKLQSRLVGIWTRIRDEESYAHTSLVVPSMSVDQSELSKIQGAAFYEERLLFTLMRLRNPQARVIYVSSQPIHPDIVDYYLHLLSGIPAAHARRRLSLLCVHDASQEPLTQKILRRPRFIERIRDTIDELDHAYLTCNNSTELERDLAVAIGIPLNGLDPKLLYWGTKSGSRQAFAEAGIDHAFGYSDIRSAQQLIDALGNIKQRHPAVRKAVIKLDHGFSGEGNALFTYPPQQTSPSREQIADSLRTIATTGAANHQTYLDKLYHVGGVAEELIEAEEMRSPSVQIRIMPDREVRLISSHEQVLGGATEQVYIGCQFPADDAYRGELQEAALAVGKVLRDAGVRSRLGIDFITSRSRGGKWRHHAVEINLRMTGTTHPFMALEFLTGGTLVDGGLLRSPRGQDKFYFSSDNLKSPHYRGLLPEDLMDIVVKHHLNFRTATETGVLFHMIGALSQYGKVGVTCVGDSPQEAEAIYRRTVEVLDNETGADRTDGGQPSPLLDRRRAGME